MVPFHLRTEKGGLKWLNARTVQSSTGPLSLFENI